MVTPVGADEPKAGLRVNSVRIRPPGRLRWTFTTYYQDYLVGTHDCVDRIVLNACFAMGRNPAGFRHWWRQLFGSDDTLDDTHLMRMAGRFRICLPARNGRFAVDIPPPAEYNKTL
jgi:hypothetical protein